ncbi:MAG: porin family protein [Dysgonamonadaceae bacterium]|nr:porin family protein [Dysgonamonadaceae bacterium]MDD4605280.1 porin family protein [Dysgonamonadaceae bacterium]
MRYNIKWLILTLCMLSTALVIEAQQIEKFKPQFMIGVGAGPLFSSVDFAPKILQTLNQGLSGGVSLKYISEKHLGLLTELNFTQRGWKEDFTETNPEHSYSRTLSYLEMPLMTHIYFGNKVRFILNIGPQISFMISDDATMNDALADYVEDILTRDPNYPIGVQYKTIDNRFDYGLVGGLGMEFNTAIGSFDLEGRYYFGLGDSFDNSRSSVSNFSRSSNRYFAGKLTYYFKVL